MEMGSPHVIPQIQTVTIATLLLILAPQKYATM